MLTVAKKWPPGHTTTNHAYRPRGDALNLMDGLQVILIT
jgi:hypothetical protein